MESYVDPISTKYNGALWLARDLSISSQYLGSGKTEKQAIEDMEKTIKKHSL